MNIRTAYRQSVSSQGHVEDPAQQLVVDQLADLQRRIVESTSPLQSLARALRIRSKVDTTGIYLWGDVGRGKTFLMDLFFQTLPIKKKTRIHFHRMMADVHARLKALCEIEDPLDGGVASCLAVIYGEGLGTPVDQVESTKWLKRGAEAGNDIAQLEYGVRLFHGRQTSRDESLGMNWMMRVGANCWKTWLSG